MKTAYAALPHIPLKPDTPFEHPPQNPELVHHDSPAREVMTDFHYVQPVTVAPNVPIDEALEKMKNRGVRLLLVVGENGAIVGLISSRDIQGEVPIRIVNEQRIPRGAITVEQVMQRPEAISVLDRVSVEGAEVGHIIEILQHLERQHILVVQSDPDTHGQKVCGLFSLSQIAKQLPSDINEEQGPAHSLAEILRQTG